MNSSPVIVGDAVVIKCSDEGYMGKTGTIVAVFESGRVQVAVGPIAILHLPPDAITHPAICSQESRTDAVPTL